jgi:hypothetical protein
MTTEEHLYRRRLLRLVVLVIAAVVTCRMVMFAVLYAVLVVLGRQQLVDLQVLAEPTWWSETAGEVLGLSVWGIFLVGLFEVIWDNGVKWRARTYTFDIVLCTIAGFLALVTWTFGFWLGDLVRVIWHAP